MRLSDSLTLLGILSLFFYAAYGDPSWRSALSPYLPYSSSPLSGSDDWDWDEEEDPTDDCCSGCEPVEEIFPSMDSAHV